MPRSADQLRRDAVRIWHAGVAAVRADRLVLENVRIEAGLLKIGQSSTPLASIRRIAVVGAGKAGAEMAEALERALGADVLSEKHVSGWVNVPENCVRPLSHI